jgi:carbamoyl-phosphate synthase large subunit
MSKAGPIKNIRIMFTCIGRRVSLLRSFQKAGKQLKLNPIMVGTDTTELSPALQLCDKKYIVKPVTHRDYLKQLLDIVRKEKVNLLIPTVDLDLKLLANNKSRFEKLGCRVLISKPSIIDICQDKRKTYQFLHENDFDTPTTSTLQGSLRKRNLRYPCFLKPWDGYASRGNAIVNNKEELRVIGRKIPNCIVQTYVVGDEFTCDVFVDFDMKVQCVVPRKRIEVRSGEVSKAQIVKDSAIMQQAAEVVETLGAGPGVITLQLIKNADEEVDFIEINPRFGGGVPLSIKAGANFPKWILQGLIKKQARIKHDGFKDGLTMLRYDDEVWCQL